MLVTDLIAALQRCLGIYGDGAVLVELNGEVSLVVKVWLPDGSEPRPPDLLLISERTTTHTDSSQTGESAL